MPEPDITHRYVSEQLRTLKAVFDHGPLPMFVVQGNGIIRRGNQAASRWSGTGSDAMAGRPIWQFVEAIDRRVVRDAFAKIPRNGSIEMPRLGHGRSVVRIWLTGMQPSPGRPLMLLTVLPDPAPSHAASLDGDRAAPS